jgi:hypothetical protein
MRGNVSFTNLRCRVQGERRVPGVSLPGAVITDSIGREKSELTEIGNGYYDVAFTFPQEIWISNKSRYFISVLADSYSFTNTAHIGWARDWPEPNYDAALATQSPSRAPYRMHVAGKRFFGV